MINKSKIDINITDVIKKMDLSGCVLSADDVSLRVIPDKNAKDNDGKTIHEQHKINMVFPLDNVSMQRIFVQALNNNKTDVSNNLRRRINKEYAEYGESSLLQEILAQVKDDVITLTLPGFPGVYPDVPLTPEQIARMNELALNNIVDVNKRMNAIDLQIERLKKMKAFKKEHGIK